MTNTAKTSLTARAAAWYTAAYRQLGRSYEYEMRASRCVYPSLGRYDNACLAECYGRRYDARAAIAARYARLASR